MAEVEKSSTTKKTTKKATIKRRAATKRTSKKTTRTRTIKKTESTRARKAPTHVPPRPVRRKLRTSTKFIISLGLGFCVIVGVSFAIGQSDAGQINVPVTISERAANELETNGEDSVVLQALAKQQNTSRLPNGGLRGRGNQRTEQQVREAAQVPVTDTGTSTASSTDEAAASTPATLGEAADIDDLTADLATSSDTASQ